MGIIHTMILAVVMQMGDLASFLMPGLETHSEGSVKRYGVPQQCDLWQARDGTQLRAPMSSQT